MGKFATTRTGIEIGCAYLAPSPHPSADAEQIQRGLLARPANYPAWVAFLKKLIRRTPTKAHP